MNNSHFCPIFQLTYEWVRRIHHSKCSEILIPNDRNQKKSQTDSEDRSGMVLRSLRIIFLDRVTTNQLESEL